MINGVEPILPSTKAELYQLLVNGKNLGSRSLAEVKGDLLRPLPADYISWKPTFSQGQKQKDVPYIAWTDCLFILDYICPNYTYQLSENQIGNQCVVKGILTLHCFDGDYTVEALGAEDLEDTSFGGAVMDASAQSMRRCLATIGCGRYLYYLECRPNKQGQPSLPSTPTERRSGGEISRQEWVAKFGERAPSPLKKFKTSKGAKLP